MYNGYAQSRKASEFEHIRTSLYVLNCLELLWYFWVLMLT